MAAPREPNAIHCVECSAVFDGYEDGEDLTDAGSIDPSTPQDSQTEDCPLPEATRDRCSDDNHDWGDMLGRHVFTGSDVRQ